MTRYRLFQLSKGEGLWTSPVFEAVYAFEANQAVIAGFLMGSPRWAVSEAGTFLYGLDAKGKPLAQAPTLPREPRLGSKAGPVQKR